MANGTILYTTPLRQKIRKASSGKAKLWVKKLMVTGKIANVTKYCTMIIDFYFIRWDKIVQIRCWLLDTHLKRSSLIAYTHTVRGSWSSVLYSCRTYNGSYFLSGAIRDKRFCYHEIYTQIYLNIGLFHKNAPMHQIESTMRSPDIRIKRKCTSDLLFLVAAVGNS